MSAYGKRVRNWLTIDIRRVQFATNGVYPGWGDLIFRVNAWELIFTPHKFDRKSWRLVKSPFTLHTPLGTLNWDSHSTEYDGFYKSGDYYEEWK